MTNVVIVVVIVVVVLLVIFCFAGLPLWQYIINKRKKNEDFYDFLMEGFWAACDFYSFLKESGQYKEEFSDLENDIAMQIALYNELEIKTARYNQLIIIQEQKCAQLLLEVSDCEDCFCSGFCPIFLDAKIPFITETIKARKEMSEIKLWIEKMGFIVMPKIIGDLYY